MRPDVPRRPCRPCILEVWGRAEIQILPWGKAGVTKAQKLAVTGAPWSPELRPGDLSPVVSSCLTLIQTQVMAHPCGTLPPHHSLQCALPGTLWVQPHPRASCSQFPPATTLFRVNKPWRFDPDWNPGVSAPPCLLVCHSMWTPPR